MTAEAKPTVYEAISAITAELPAIGKGDKSPEGYGYRGIEAVTKHLQPLLAKHGVVIVPTAEVLATVPSPAMKDGWQDIVMRVEWTIVGPDGSELKAVTNGIGRDRSDKGANKAQTQAFKYLVLHLFCIADAKDDTDGHSYESDRQSDSQPVEMVTDGQKAEFAEIKAQLGEQQTAALKAWFRREKVPAFDKLTADMAATAIAKARGFLSTGGTVEPEPDGQGELAEAGK